MPKANPSPLERLGQRSIPQGSQMVPQVQGGGQFQPPSPMPQPPGPAWGRPDFPGQAQGMPFNQTMPQQWPPAPIPAAMRPPMPQQQPPQRAPLPAQGYTINNPPPAGMMHYGLVGQNYRMPGGK